MSRWKVYSRKSKRLVKILDELPFHIHLGLPLKQNLSIGCVVDNSYFYVREDLLLPPEFPNDPFDYPSAVYADKNKN